MDPDGEVAEDDHCERYHASGQEIKSLDVLIIVLVAINILFYLLLRRTATQ